MLATKTLLASSDGSVVESANRLLAQEMRNMSLQERWRMEMDVQGKNVLAAVEPSELSSIGLCALEDELKLLKEDTFYRMALKLESHVVKSREFLLKFARADAFDPIKAAVRLERYLELVHRNFGNEGLMRPIRMSDLDKVERDLLKMEQYNCYLAVTFPVAGLFAFHFCFSEDQRLAAICVRSILLAIPQLRARSRIHVGSVTECQYALLKYSIPSDHLPITNTGNVKTQNHLKWISYLEAKEEAMKQNVSFNGIDCPSVKDVLAGKGPHVSNHPGNVEFRKIVSARFDEHFNAPTIERKTAITWEVVLEVQERGGRFLLKNKNWWVVSDPDSAREKVSIAFRDRRKYLPAQAKMQRSKMKTKVWCDVDISESKKRKC